MKEYGLMQCKSTKIKEAAILQLAASFFCAPGMGDNLAV
jgi:hypothetical protein